MPWRDYGDFSRDKPPTKKEAEQVLEYQHQRAKPRFYADENFPADAVRLLRRWKHARIRTAQEVGLTGHPDENHAAFALRTGSVLLTCDRDYLDGSRFPLVHCPAIVVFDFGGHSVGDMVEAFRCLGAIFAFPQFFDKWVRIEAKRECWTESWRFLDGTTMRKRLRLYKGTLQEWVDG